jgi:hypothetical protein
VRLEAYFAYTPEQRRAQELGRFTSRRQHERLRVAEALEERD